MKDENEEDILNRNNEEIEDEKLDYKTHNTESISQMKNTQKMIIGNNKENIHL